MRLFNFGRKPKKRRTKTPKTIKEIYNEYLGKELKRNPDKLHEFTINMSKKMYGIDLGAFYRSKSQNLTVKETKTDIEKEIS